MHLSSLLWFCFPPWRIEFVFFFSNLDFDLVFSIGILLVLFIGFLLKTGSIGFAEMENRLNLRSQQKNCASKLFLVLEILRKENGWKSQTKSSIYGSNCSLYVRFRDDDIDLGEHSSDESDFDSDWECKVETNADAAAPDSASMFCKCRTR